MNEKREAKSERSPDKAALVAVRKLRARLDAMDRARKEPIAIVGIGCRFPGNANDPESYWDLLRDGVDAVTEVSDERWDRELFYDSEPTAAGKTNSRWGGFVEGLDRFDPSFFDIAPREAAQMDPQQRLVLETTWEAIENAGLTRRALASTPTGVFLGVATFDYMVLQADDKAPDPSLLTGSAHSVHAGRLSYLFDLQGPCMAVDTACSSSLVAVHLACQSLRNGDCNVALAGGANALLNVSFNIAFAKGGFLAGDGRCKTFDSRADGYVRGEGCGMVVLKRLSDAVADGDDIWAVIRGSAVNQDGRSAGLTAPSQRSQQRVIEQALASAGAKPEEISYVEAHGTGTPLGDPIEIEALTNVVGRPREDGSTCKVGSVKTNFGHLEAAAGVAGLIKVALSLRHREIPPHLNFEKLNPGITFENTPFEIPTALEP